MSGVLVGFATEQGLNTALERLAAAGLGEIETYTPVAPAEDRSRSRLPLLMFVAGMIGFIGCFLLMAHADVTAYPVNVGGRPRFAWPAFVPIAFELAVLCALVAGFIGYFASCRMPRLYDPIDGCDGFARASRDRWFVALRVVDAQRLALVRALVDPLGPVSIEEFGA